MNLIWRFLKRIMAGIRRRRGSVMAVPRNPDQVGRKLEAQVALGRSRAIQRRVDSNEVRVDRLHESMQKLGEQNGFAALILKSLGGRTE